ncbi:ABC transporter ATP-binding protein [Myroides sp. NP-2]|uniref:ABC transporter ATP-binding protein n=1 Tax=Myroides sp. NP-2 TaxID=2759945 RepID=UPI0015F8891D|nr:ABC transporter ATP-binding protein [Myroides sp. NP-2]MBB1150281.1 ABC transporter ATP-binding protein [Myroides sp. NP-2]
MLHTKALTIGYSTGRRQTKVIQESLTFELTPNSLTTLLGINGIGKSTLLRTLIGHQPPLSGGITLGDKPLTSYSAHELAKEISVVLTEPIPQLNLRVIELLQISRTPHVNWQAKLTKEDQYWIDKAVDLTSIASLVHQPLMNLSDGQLQRVLIAKALAQNTPLLILDEPSSHLDLNHKVKLYQLLHHLTREENKTILFSSHDIELALHFADEALVLQADGYTKNTIDALIANGVFDRFFQEDYLRFDRQNKRFTLVQ